MVTFSTSVFVKSVVAAMSLLIMVCLDFLVLPLCVTKRVLMHSRKVDVSVIRRNNINLLHEPVHVSSRNV